MEQGQPTVSASARTAASKHLKNCFPHSFSDRSGFLIINEIELEAPPWRASPCHKKTLEVCHKRNYTAAPSGPSHKHNFGILSNPLRKIFSLTALLLLDAGSLQGASIYWDGTGNNVGSGWGSKGYWSRSSGAATPNPSAAPGSADLAIFSINTVNTAQIVQLGGNRTAMGLAFQGTNTATTTLLGGGTNQKLTLGTSGIVVNSGAGAVTLGSSTSGQNVTITLSGAQTWTNNSANALTLVNAITNGGYLLSSNGTGDTAINGAIDGNGGLTKSGAGTLTLGGANTYTGLTTVSAGTLEYGVTNALSTGGITVAGGTLDLNTFNETVGAVTLASGSITGSTGVLTGTSYNLTNTGSVSAILAGTAALTKTGAGTATLSGTNTYTGVTTLSAGTLSVGSIGNGGVAGNLGQATNAASNLVFNGGTLQYTGADATTNRNFTLNAGTTGTFDITTNNLTISGASTATTGALTKIGAGTLTLAGNNLYTGLTTVNAGTLKLGKAGALGTTGTGTTVNSGAVLDLGGQVIGTEALTLNGTGISNSGALINSSGTAASLSGTVAISTNSSIGGSGNLTLSGVISGSGSLTKVGAGTLTLNGTVANTLSGMTTVNEGTLVLSNTVINGAIPGALTIGDGIGTDTVNITVSGQLGNSSPVTINSSGVLNISMAGGLDTIGTLTMTSGSVTTGTGTLFVSGDVTGNANANSATISGNLNLNANGNTNPTAVRTFTIADGAAAEDMVISAVVADGALTKAGAGTLTLSGANTYVGATTVNDGKLTIASSGTINTSSAVSIAGGEFNYNSATALSQPVSFSGTGGTLSGTGTITPAVTVTSGNTYTAGAVGVAGTQTFSNALTFNSGSIFQWDLAATPADTGSGAANSGSYDKVVANGAVTGTAVFQVVLGSNSFTDAFWDTDKTWSNIFTGSGSYNLASLFTTFGGAGIVPYGAIGLVPGQGQFTFTYNTLRWTAVGGGFVPEPTNALAGMLLAAGLLRRRR
jgi:autotransporter-associated beta strand protein